MTMALRSSAKSASQVQMHSAEVIASGELFPPRSSVAATLAVFALNLGLTFVVRYYALFPSVIDSDESLYLIIAQHWLQGELPYQSVWDQHSVGLPALFAIIELIFDNSLTAIRLSADIAVAATATIIYSTARLLNLQRLGAAAAAVFYIAWTARWWGLSANCELYLTALIAGAMHILLRETIAPSPLTRQAFRYCLASFLLGVAVQVKQVAIAETALFGGIALYAIYSSTERSRIWVCVAAGVSFVLPSLIVVAYFAAYGLAMEYLRAVVLYNIAYLGAHPTMAQLAARIPRSFILAIIVVVFSAFAVWRDRDRHHGFILAWAIAAAVDVTLPGQFWPHYFILLLPPAALLLGYVADIAERAWPWSKAGPWQARLLFLVAVFFWCNPLAVYADIVRTRNFVDDDAPRVVARLIGDQPDDYIFVLNYHPIVYFLTQSRLPSKHVLPGEWSEDFRGPAGVDPLAELDKVFRRHPAFVVFVDSDVVNMGPAVMERMRKHLSDYQRYGAVIDSLSMPKPRLVEIYRRSPQSDAAGRPEPQ